MRIQVNARNRGFEYDARAREAVLYAGLRSGVDLPYECATGTDVTLQVPKFIGAAESGFPRPENRVGVVREPRMLTHDVMAFSLELDAPCDFDAGQFMVLAAPGVAGYRGYSMTNYQRGTRRLGFVVKKKPGGGFSEWLFGGERNGARVEGFGPLGKATFDPTLGKNVLCIAGGSGIAGMMSILARAAETRYFDGRKMWLFFGVRTMRDVFFLDELRR